MKKSSDAFFFSSPILFFLSFTHLGSDGVIGAAGVESIQSIVSGKLITGSLQDNTVAYKR